MLFKLLFAPVTAPVSSFRLLLNQMKMMAENELFDVDKLHNDLIALQLRLEENEITYHEYAQREAEILAQLRAAKERQMRGSGVV
jgi:hypothetical protein